MVSVNDVELFVKEAGSGPPILLIHGTGIDADTWGPIFDDLASDHRAIAYDRRGFTRSAGVPATPNWKLHAADAAALLRELDAVPATVVGWSAGGIVALDLAVNHPELVSGLVLLDAGLHAVKHPSRGFLAAWVGSQLAGRRRGPEAAADRFMTYTCGFRGGESVWGEYPEERKQVVRANGAAMLVEMRAAGRDRHLNAKALGALRMPVTIAHGERTQPFFETCARATAELIPHARLRAIEGANHALGYTAPDATAALIREAASAAARPVGTVA